MKLSEKWRAWREKRAAGRESTSRASGVRLPVPRDPVPRAPVERLRYYGKRFPARALTMMGIVAAFVLVYLLADFTMRSGYFTITEWETYGLRRLNEDDIRALATGAANQDEINLVTFNVRDAEQRLASHPSIYHARVRKAYPNRVEVLVYERREEAVLVTSTGAYLADIDGVLFARASGRELLDSRLPLLTVPDTMTFEAGDHLPSEFFDAALVYAGVFDNELGSLAGMLSEIHWDPGTGLTLILRDGTRLLCGTLPPAETLPKWEALREKIGGPGRIDYADLRLDTDLPWKPYAPAVTAVARR
ncbi:MAG: cell division protein FtsQ [Candidatus Sumerlaeota bacterium]|nr:cell division protein FtsQ [Candidatus Sumerlaeota bacterium]